MTNISNRDDVIDSRDVIERIAELEDERADLLAAIGEAERERDEMEDPDEGAQAKVAETRENLEAWDDEYGGEMKALVALQEEAEPYAPDWRHGETLIRDSYFTEYAEQLADDIGAIDRNANWPVCHIDWEAAASSLKQDYTPVDFDGVKYWIRG